MGKRKTVKRGVTPSYPTDSAAKMEALLQNQDVEAGKDPHTWFKKTKLDATIDILRTWGVNGIYFVYSFPPAGFYIAEPDEVLELKTFEGWIFEKKSPASPMNLLVKASRDGVDFFWSEHKRYTGK